VIRYSLGYLFARTTDRLIFMEPEVCHWMVDSVQIVLFGVACGVGTDAAARIVDVPARLAGR
jgi:hypothetical protein